MEILLNETAYLDVRNSSFLLYSQLFCVNRAAVAIETESNVPSLQLLWNERQTTSNAANTDIHKIRHE